MPQNLNSLLHEGKDHGSQDYPIEYYLCHIPETYNYLPAHWHEEMEIGMVASGKVNYQIGDKEYTLSEGSLIFIAPNMLHSASQLGKLPAETHSIVFHLKMAGLAENDRCAKHFIEPFQDGRLQPPPVIGPTHPGYPDLLATFRELWSYQEPRGGEELLVKAAILRLLYQLLQISEEPSTLTSTAELQYNSEKIKPVLSYIQDHYTEPMTIDELAGICGFSAVHFMNIFKKVIGATCMEYIIEYRIAMSTVALKNTTAPIMKIAMDHGFQNISYYNRTFRKKMGMTPTEYRKRLKSQTNG